ncbi:MAG: hypothetical protein L6Q77_12060 [Bacteroidetes bacterium]|nr:hypothetical protein [Bacteroidota bacterium]
MRSLISSLLTVIFSTSVSAQWIEEQEKDKVPKVPVKEFTYIGFYYTHVVGTNFYATNDLLKGQIVGRLFSSNYTNTAKKVATYAEQRYLPFFIYQPKLLDGKAILRASFEIDWTWGDASYGVGGNFGSAFSADQVNIQTQNVELELIPAKGWAINFGLQRLFDTPNNPYRTGLTTLTTTGYRLAFWGSDAVGVSVRQDADYYRWKAGAYQLYENNVQENDDVIMSEAMLELDITPTWKQGFSGWYVFDRGNGEGGVSVLGQGLNSMLNDYNGTFSFNFGGAKYKADVVWMGTFWNRNAELNLDCWGLSGFVVANMGKAQLDTTGSWVTGADILGFAANLRAGYKYGQTGDDIVTADFIYTSGDDNGIKDKKYSGVITGNTWGSPGGIFIGHGAYILFPHGNVVNRFVAAVSDISNIGYGVAGGTLNLHHDFIPYKLMGKVGMASALSPVSPKGGGSYIGTELNFKIRYTPRVFMDIELHGAYLALGDFYDSPLVNGGQSNRHKDPWTLFTSFRWLMF